MTPSSLDHDKLASIMEDSGDQEEDLPFEWKESFDSFYWTCKNEITPKQRNCIFYVDDMEGVRRCFSH